LQIRQLFHTFARKHDLDRDMPAYDCTRFRAPQTADRQLRLF
jgi:hypothetical protein